MEAYETLRKAARSKRDAIVRKAQADCRAAIRKIDDLEKKVGHGGPPRAKGSIRKGAETLGVMRAAVPQTGTFTTNDMQALVQRAQPDRVVPLRSITSAIHRLRVAGVVRIVRRAHHGKVIWAATGAEESDTPFATLRLPDAAARVLAECGPLTDLEIVLGIQQRGCRTDNNPKAVLRSLVKSLRESHRFTLGDDGLWMLVHQ